LISLFWNSLLAWGLLGVQLEMRSAGLTAQGVMVARSSHKACRCTIVGTENWILEKILWHIQESGSMLMEILEEQHGKPWKTIPFASLLSLDFKEQPCCMQTWFVFLSIGL